MSTARTRSAVQDYLTLDHGERQKAIVALQTFARRQARVEHPEGWCHRSGCWYPCDAEKAVGTFANARAPSAARPLSFLHAARSIEHCEGLHGADHAAVLIVRRVIDMFEIEYAGAEAAVVMKRLTRAIDAIVVKFTGTLPVFAMHKKKLGEQRARLEASQRLRRRRAACRKWDTLADMQKQNQQL
jgi:hypothetical protein